MRFARSGPPWIVAPDARPRMPGPHRVANVDNTTFRHTRHAVERTMKPSCGRDASAFAIIGLLLLSLANASAAATTAPSDRESRREKQRAAYRPVALADPTSPRQELSLSGDWLFTPSTDPSAAGG